MRFLTIVGLFAILVCNQVMGRELQPMHKLPRPEQQARLERDLRAVQLHRQGLRSVISFMKTQPDLFSTESSARSGLMRREQKEAVWNLWQRFLDYMLALDSLEKYYAGFARLNGEIKEDSFLVGYAAMLARYRTALEFIDRTDANPDFNKILNDAVPEIGLPPNTFAKLKFKYLNVAIATEFAARDVLFKTFAGERQPALRKKIQEDADYIWKTGRIRGGVLTAKNALKVLQDGAHSAWLPVQAGVADWMGDVKVHRVHNSLISERQVQLLQPCLAPGDVLLERREWYLSNIGLPGFWSHAAIYIGTPEERRAFFDDPETRAWIKEQGEATGELDQLLKSRSPVAYAQLQSNSPGAPARIVEAIGEGVSLTTLEHSAACDSLAVLRPRLSKIQKAQALIRAFHYVGRPYDFDFDFATDTELVCTELVYKCYEPAAGFKGLTLPLTEVMGHKVTPANELAKQFDLQFEASDQQFDLVRFLDGQERDNQAIEASLEQFRQSWRRPKWHVLTQK